MTAQSQAKELPDFETAITELESIVNQMEVGNLSLEASLNAYKRGAELLQFCQKLLTEAEQQVRILNDANKLMAFEPSNEQNQ
jgi:exodeoxyribonuclease VII small subunit